MQFHQNNEVLQDDNTGDFGERDYFAKSARRLNSINILDLQAGNTFFSGNAFFSKEHASEDTVLLFVIFLAKL